MCILYLVREEFVDVGICGGRKYLEKNPLSNNQGQSTTNPNPHKAPGPRLQSYPGYIGGRWSLLPLHHSFAIPALFHITVPLGCKCILIMSVTYHFLPVLAQCREGNFPGESKKITYKELLLEVCKFANVLKGKGKNSVFSLDSKQHLQTWLPNQGTGKRS